MVLDIKVLRSSDDAADWALCNDYLFFVADIQAFLDTVVTKDDDTAARIAGMAVPPEI